uniref:Uncharacterized protein n=1 Tax=Attheya septentrionalis TaxID=420275 RepID=A0A6T7I4N0_9STRA|mmetsp:Transcript_24034/g.43451  ORF Transcript_24034/g.43451 Transcript_24034/m.43451 type:complete len:367 (+) Transcript_24034:105-1205(+)|eukprot:CAMPEP_0198283414 /NCGR_PEP_ID=MMETSP1449-20131203/3006_1 /TAXON_ID=420275 /ORGANISM="Attheya septentrionalis, Strain CCMP2084" /LENGTH=366 /DNA_ID=CAMNT_0043979999 /DNA_START=93 /DNA_END=1193 /DNA_ORIENTATION=-
MTLAQVNDKDGKAIAKVKVGDTKEIALNRLSQGHGLLVDKHGLGLTDADRITGDDAPYTFTPVSQEAQQDAPSSKRPRRVAYSVGVVVKGAINSNGARGNVYKFLQRHAAFFSTDEGLNIKYEGMDLHVKAYFLDMKDACEFQNAVNEWEIHKELAHLDGVDLVPATPQEVDLPRNLERILLQHYRPKDFESPCQTIAYLHSYHLLDPLTEPAENDSALIKYQSIDKMPLGVVQYKCHLHDKAKNKRLQNNENNMVAASWYFHQLLDGVHTDDKIPLVVLTFVSASEARLADKDNRYQVKISVEFFDQKYRETYQAPVGARLMDGVWQTSVFVKDKNIFKTCVDWKEQDTRNKWKQHKEWLSGNYD